MMKKLLIPALLSLTLCNSAMAYEYDGSWCDEGDGPRAMTGVFSTGQHKIVISEYAQGRFKYEAWNEPKDIMDDMPDWVMSGGKLCPMYTPRECLYFKKGNTEFVINHNPQTNSDMVGELTIFINGVQKRHYWMRSWYPRICDGIN